MEKQMKTSRALAALVAVLALVMAACNGESASTTVEQTESNTAVGTLVGDPVKIGLIAQEEELVAYPEMRVAAKAGADYINSELGGVDGAPLEIEVCTVGDTPETTVTCAQQFANDDDVKFVLMGTLNSGAGNEVLVEVGKPVLSLSNDLPDIMTPGVYAFDPGALVLAAGLLQFSAEDLDASTYALLVPDDPFYTDVVVPLVEALGGLYGLTPAGNAVTLPLEGDPTAAVTAADDLGGDVLIAVANGPQCLSLADSANAIGVSTPIVGADTCMTSDVISSGSLDGWYAISVCEGPVDPSRRSDDRFTNIVNDYGGGDPALNSSFGCWALANVLVAAEVLGDVGGAEATSENIIAAMDGYTSDDLPAYPPASCPGPDPFIGACLRTTTILRIDGDIAVPETRVEVDVTQLGFLLEG
jgi:ABC-type branched-subunit amino acid transport system substrate-binding protein